MKNEILDDNFYELANAIVLQACKDYKLALQKRDEFEIRVLEKFFLSEYFEELVRNKINGWSLIKEMKKQVGVVGEARLLKRRRARLKGDDDAQ